MARMRAASRSNRTGHCGSYSDRSIVRSWRSEPPPTTIASISSAVIG
jgi:hypothetical protein